MLKSQGIISSKSNVKMFAILSLFNCQYVKINVLLLNCQILKLSFHSKKFLFFFGRPRPRFFGGEGGGGVKLTSLSIVFFLLDWLIFLIVSGDVVDNFTLRIGFCLGLLAPTIIMTWNRISIMHKKNNGEGKGFFIILGN